MQKLDGAHINSAFHWRSRSLSCQKSVTPFGSDAVLIYPPFISYFAGPPLGIASLSAALQNGGYSCHAWDVNAEFMHHLARSPALLVESEPL